MAILQAIPQTSPDRITTEKSTARCTTDSPHGMYCAVIISEDGIVNIITTQTVDGISDDAVGF